MAKTPRKPRRRKPKNPGNFANDRKRAAEAGRLGGTRSRGGGGREQNPANFANNREKAREAGRKGGLARRKRARLPAAAAPEDGLHA